MGKKILQKKCGMKLKKHLDNSKIPVKKCKSYFEKLVVNPVYNTRTGLIQYYEKSIDGHCNGTQEVELCHCCGNPLLCDFYESKREEAKMINEKYAVPFEKLIEDIASNLTMDELKELVDEFERENERDKQAVYKNINK